MPAFCTVTEAVVLVCCSQVGINIMPTDDDAAALASSSVSVKVWTHAWGVDCAMRSTFVTGLCRAVLLQTSTLEEYVYEHLGFLSATFAVRGSKWNKNLNESEALVQLRECLDPSEDASDIHEVGVLLPPPTLPQQCHGPRCIVFIVVYFALFLPLRRIGDQ